MFRTIPRLALPLVKRSFATSSVVARPFAVAARFQPQRSSQLQFRSYSAEAGLTHEAIQARILEVLTSFEKVDPAKVSATAAFTSDLGLDSLDSVEVVMAIEEEFSIEIPDEEADRITTVGEAIEYISKTPEAH